MSVNSEISSSIRAFIPGFKYVSISITGSHCSLMCDYCKGHYLKGMKNIVTPKQLFDLVRHLHKEGVKGVLISGGFNKGGYLPIQPYLNIIKEIKDTFNILVSVHTGLIDKSLAIKLRDAKVDVVDYELILDDEVIKDVMHLSNKKSEDFIRTYEILHNYGPPHIIPHILIGANYGKITVEFETVDVAKTLSPEVLVFLIVTPTEGTPMQFIKPPKPQEIVELIKYARHTFKGELAIGCMRPLTMKYMVDDELCRQGIIDRIVNPLKTTSDKFKLTTVHSCCSIPNELLRSYGII
ncbi:MAG: radical SAM protein [Sulfolobales archaeon]